jgi:low temperature requirement protein LtrA
MRARDPEEPHRVATPLELLFDLCFVVAIAQAARGLHHGIGAGHVADALIAYAMVFFGIWWAWMQFTWFASAYDSDDVTYRLMVMVQIVGVLVIAAGVPRAFEHRDLTVITVGYVLLRLGLVPLWLRAASGDADGAQTAKRYALAIVISQVAWCALLSVPRDLQIYFWPVGVVGELMTPLWAEKYRVTQWHPHHITERYSLFTLIVLGESVAAATLAIQAAVDASAHPGMHLVCVIVAAPLIFFSMWWLYFVAVDTGLKGTDTSAFYWGYGHYVVFASAAAVGAGLSAEVEHPAGLAVSIPAALYVASVWLVHCFGRHPVMLVGAALVAPCGLLPRGELISGLLLVAITIVTVRGIGDRAPSAHGHPATSHAPDRPARPHGP